MNTEDINFALMEHGAGVHKYSESKTLQNICYECYKTQKHKEKVEDYHLQNRSAGVFE